MPGGERLVEKSLDLLDAGRQRTTHPMRWGEERVEPGDALGVRSIDQRRPVEVEAVEEDRHERKLGTQTVDVELPPEAAHGDLKRLGTTGRRERDRLAVEHDLADGKRADGVDDLRQRGGHVVSGAREYPDVVAGPVRLDACAVELELERRLTPFRQHVGGVAGGVRQHRRDRAEEIEREPRQARSAFAQRGARDLRQVAAQHRGAAYRCRGKIGGARDRVRHDPFQRPLAELAEQEPYQEGLLVGGGATEKRSERALTLDVRPPAGDRGQALESAVDLDEREGGLAGRRRAAQRRELRVPYPQPSLPRLAGQKGNAARDLLGPQPAKAFGERGDLREPGARRAHRVRRTDEVDEEHAST